MMKRTLREPDLGLMSVFLAFRLPLMLVFGSKLCANELVNIPRKTLGFDDSFPFYLYCRMQSFCVFCFSELHQLVCRR